MFERFQSRFRRDPDSGPGTGAWGDDRLHAVRGFDELIGPSAGASFDNGLYRLHSAESAAVGQSGADLMFPRYAGRLSVFAFDWLGRQFAVDFGRVDGGAPLVMLLEPGTGEALEIPAPFVQFHDEELVDYGNEALASEFFAEWVAANPGSVPLGHTDCVGYRVPLFLSGSDTVDNLEVVDFDVYWTIAAQIRSQLSA
jgi:hypothetical protein